MVFSRHPTTLIGKGPLLGRFGHRREIESEMNAWKWKPTSGQLNVELHGRTRIAHEGGQHMLNPEYQPFTNRDSSFVKNVSLVQFGNRNPILFVQKVASKGANLDHKLFLICDNCTITPNRRIEARIDQPYLQLLIPSLAASVGIGSWSQSS